MLKRIYIAHAPIVGRKKWFLEHGYPEQFKIAVDYALFLSSYNTSRFASIPEPLYICREYVTHSLSKYTRTSLSVMKIIWTYGRETHSLPAVFLAILYYNAKVLIYVAATILGCHRKLISRRMEVAGKSDQELFEQAIKIIRLTTVPGLQRYVKTG
jgi:hypothetical protein